ILENKKIRLKELEEEIKELKSQKSFFEGLYLNLIFPEHKEKKRPKSSNNEELLVENEALKTEREQLLTKQKELLAEIERLKNPPQTDITNKESVLKDTPDELKSLIEKVPIEQLKTINDIFKRQKENFNQQLTNGQNQNKQLTQHKND
ncbi:19446_t:CDS:1, partial [Racocetra persica]